MLELWVAEVDGALASFMAMHGNMIEVKCAPVWKAFLEISVFWS